MRSLFIILLLTSTIQTACVSIPRYVARPQKKAAIVPQQTMDMRKFCKRPGYSFVGGVGDSLYFSLLETAAYHKVILKIDPTGSINVPFVGRIQAAGNTLEDIQSQVMEKLKRYFRAPQVTIQWDKVISTNVTILGLVNKPGSIVISTPLRLSRVLAKAGGFKRALNGSFAGNTLADLTRSFVQRPGQGTITPNFTQLLQGNATQDIWILPGDTLVFPRQRKHTYIALGEFRKPQRFVQTNPLRILSLVAQSGGLKEGASGQLLVIRGSIAKAHVSQISFQDILNGKSPNILLSPDDVIYAPPSGLTKFHRIAKRIIPLISVFFDGFRTFSGTGLLIPSPTIR